MLNTYILYRMTQVLINVTHSGTYDYCNCFCIVDTVVTYVRPLDTVVSESGQIAVVDC